MIKERRSIRKYKDEVVPESVMREIVEVAKYAPSWANYQIARYNFVTDPAVIAQIADKGVNGFVYNKGTLANAKNVLVLSYVLGKSGKLDLEKSDYATSKSTEWEMFDAGIACQTFCLAAHEKGLGTCIFGVIDDDAITDIIALPEGEKVGAVVVYGYPDEEGHPSARKVVDDIVRFK